MVQRRQNSVVRFIKERYVLLIFLFFASVVLGLLFSRASLFLSERQIFPEGVRYVSDQIIIKYRDGQSPKEYEARGKINLKEKLLGSLSEIGAISQKKLFENADGSLANYYVLNLKPGISVPDIYSSLRNIPEIEAQAPNYILKIQDVPNDPYFPDMWNLKKNSMEKAWDITHTNGVLVGVIDTGVDYNHEDLKGAVIKGKNFIKNNNDPMDDQGHGTHVAGILGAITNNGIGVSGVSWGARILAVKACDSDGNCNTTDVSQAIKYAVDKGVKVINVSIAGPGSCNGTYSDILNYAKEKGVFVVSAAGNGQNGTGAGVNADNQIPASCDNVLAVGALNNKNTRSSFSNFGRKVRIAAYGGQSPCDLESCILSTSLNNKYSLRSGTSMAAPQITGLAALILGYNPSLTADKVVSCMIRGGDSVMTDNSVGPKLNAERALRLCARPKKEETSPSPTKKLETFSIAGIVFVDANGNKKLDSNDVPYKGAQVILSGYSNESVISNTKGQYSFLNLKPGLYSISWTANGQNIGNPVDAVLSSEVPSVNLNLYVPSVFVPTPTEPLQKTASGCYIDPSCLTGKKAFQVCSFRCYP